MRSQQEDEDFAFALALQAAEEDADVFDEAGHEGEMVSLNQSSGGRFFDNIWHNFNSVLGSSASANHTVPQRAASSYASSGEALGDQTQQQNQNRDDYSFAWLLQQMEFEIPYETEEEQRERELHGEFEGKEYRASKCKNQLKSFSTFLVAVQVILFWAMCESAGMDPQNPMIGPSSLTLVEWGAKDTPLIVYRGDWWRLITPIMMHAGVIHLLSNTLIQLRVGGYLNIVFGTPRFTIIYLLSGIFGNLLSCIFLPDGVSVGASGALLGILGAWSVWIIFRWNKIPEQLHSQRNCQLTMIVVCITITLVMSFTAYVDWAAHFGGAFQGFLLGLIFLSHELDKEATRWYVRAAGMLLSFTSFVCSIWYLLSEVRPSREILEYYDYYGVD